MAYISIGFLHSGKKTESVKRKKEGEHKGKKRPHEEPYEKARREETGKPPKE